MNVQKHKINLSGMRPTWAEINLDALRFNLNSITSHLPDGVKMMAVVKADAYGHGAKQIARCLQLEGVEDFGVAIAEEGQTLREIGVEGRILVFGGCYPGQEDLFFNNSLIPTVYDLQTLKNFFGVNSFLIPSCKLGLLASGFHPIGICLNAFILNPIG